MENSIMINFEANKNEWTKLWEK